MPSNLPPGVTVGMIEAQFGEGPCDICGRGVDDCVCPVCAKCEGQGDRKCYREHGLTVTAEQVQAWHDMQVARIEEQLHDAQMAASMFMMQCELPKGSPDGFDAKDWNWIATRG